MRYCLLVLGLMFVGGTCLAQDMAELDVDHNVRSEFVTPHTAWATPYVHGKTRVLFFLNGRGTNPREVVELKQRFDFEPQMVFWSCPTIEYRPGWEVEYDECAMRLGKAILWAAGKEPKLSLELTPKGKELRRATLPAAAATLQWKGATPGAIADITLRRDDGRVIVTDRQTLDKPEGELDVNMPVVRSGRYHLDIVARDVDRVASFTSTSLVVTCQEQGVQLALDQDWVEVRLPDGSLADWVDAVEMTDRQGVVMDVPVAHNDPKGTWTLNATDLYTGKSVTAQFTVD